MQTVDVAFAQKWQCDHGIPEVPCVESSIAADPERRLGFCALEV
jgi:hypothetical protein